MARRAIQLDDRQQDAVNVRRNAVVTAGAGSGKTRVLAERYRRLVVDDGVSVDRILTLTFTRKAAAEMYERIYHSLAADRDTSFVAEQLGRFETAQISTVDSFCGQIARNGCTRFGVPTSFRVDEEETDRLAEDAALSFLLDNRRNPVLARFIALNGFESVWKAGFALLAREYVLVSREQNPAEWLAHQLAELGRLYRRQLGELENEVAVLRDLPPAVKAIATAQAAFAEASLDPDWDPRTADDGPAGLEEVTAAAKALHRRTGNSTAEGVETFKELVGSIKERVADINTLVDTFRVREDLGELYRLVGEFEEQVRAEKRRRGLLSYRDVMELAVDLLTSDETLRSYYTGRFSYIMIDEFQDNNELQKKLLYLLSLRPGATPGPDGHVDAAELDPEKLFFVGDEKQSIYRFRGADVSVFKSLADELSASGGDALELPYNYRSSPSLITFFNSVFARAMGGASADYEARFAPLEPPVGAPADPRTRVRVAWKPFDGATSDGATSDGAASDGAAVEDLLDRDEAEAYYVARTIRDAVDAGSWTARTDDGERAATYDDVAILMRSTSNQRHYERMLRLFGIPYSTQSVRSLYESAPAYDVYNVLQLCVHPEDRAAYASVLRSPLCNVSDAALARILLSEAAPFAEEAAAELGEEDAGKYRRGAGLYAELVDRVDEEPVSRLVADLWYRFGYRYRLLASPALHPYLEYYDHLYELARTMDDRPTAEFVDALRDNLGVYARSRELEVVRDEQRGVQLMTIHKSKGLEFPVVVLANTGNMGRKSGIGTQPFYLSERFGLTASMPSVGARLADRSRVNYFFVEGERENDAKELAELKRLLYVALTRAESHLLVTGVFNSTNRTAESHLLNQLMTALGIMPDAPEAGATQSSVPVETELIPDVPRSATFGAPGRRPRRSPEDLLAHYRRSDLVRRNAVPREITVTELSERHHGVVAGPAGGGDRGYGGEQELPPVASEALLEERGLSTFFGTLTHFLIERALSGGVVGDAPAVPRRDELPPGLRREALRRELTDEEYARLAADAAALAAGFLSSRLAEELASCRLESEVPFLLHREIGGEPAWITGQIDLLAEGGEDAEITVIDFKTDRIYRPEAHLLQLALYREAAAELYGREARALVYYLRSGQVEEAGEMPTLEAELLSGAGSQASKTM